MKCPRCGMIGHKVLYMGLPMKFCLDPECSCLWGFWSDLLMEHLPFNGWFFFYEGNYVSALWHWLFCDEQ